jgi:hypothetical protein
MTKVRSHIKKILHNTEQCNPSTQRFWQKGLVLLGLILRKAYCLYQDFWADLQCIRYRAVNEDAVKQAAMINLQKAGRKNPAQYGAVRSINLEISANKDGCLQD